MTDTNDTTDPNLEPVYAPEDQDGWTPPNYDEAAVDAGTDTAAVPEGDHAPANLTDRKVDDATTEAPNA